MSPSGQDLEGVRSELRRLGYLDHRFERFLLQDALRPRQPVRTLLLLTAKVGLLAGLALALVLALALAVANGNLTASPLDLIPLFLHLFLPISLATGLAFLALCGVIVLVIRLYHVRRIEALSLAMALAAGAGVLAFALRLGGEALAEGRLWEGAGPVLVTPPLIYLLGKLTYKGLLTLATRFTDAAPLGRLFSRRWIGFAILAGAALLVLPSLVSAVSAGRRSPAAGPAGLPPRRAPPPPPPPPLPSDGPGGPAHRAGGAGGAGGDRRRPPLGDRLSDRLGRAPRARAHGARGTGLLVPPEA